MALLSPQAAREVEESTKAGNIKIEF